ncbi:MAG: asparagine synthase (glutamine-hydrolyzing) [Leptospirales bacterium]|nr:asparagine synthase (glutamine-hydrolyzing) [Leptospirales bacterium]
MCGITGIVSFSLPREQASVELRKMTDLLVHRGPDSHGYFEEGRIGLGHRRLAIVDLSIGGAQPKQYGDRFAISYNGEIYNYVELREELKGLGYSFNTDSDTEVLLAAFAEWNVGALDHLNGMFAFALYDKLTGDVHFARDRFGVKPLYYFQSGGAFYFASEPKAFTALQDWNPLLNETIALDFLRYGITDFGPETFFRGVFQLLPGHRATLFGSSQELKVSRWYDPAKAKSFQGSFDAACQEFRDLFRDSVRLRLRSDVKVGSCLSGGLDSSSIVCQMNALLKANGGSANQETVSACSDSPAFDERPFIDEVVRATETTNHRVFPDFEGVARSIDRAVWHQDEPFSSTSIMAQWFVFEEARKRNLLVMLDGQGADEQLAGYGKYQGSFLLELLLGLRVGEFFREANSLARKVGWLSVFRSMLRNLLPAWLHFLSSFVSTPSYSNLAIFKWMRGISLRRLALREILHTSLPMLLRYEDRNSMAHSVESRTPFLDFRLVEFSLSLPPDFKIQDSIAKRILREGMRGRIPDRIADRKDKMAFVTPEFLWMKEHPEFFAQQIEETQRIAKGLGGDELYRRAIKSVKAAAGLDPLVWRVWILGRWMRVFKVTLPES